MSTYSVTSQPQELLPGWQGDTTIVNRGPSTVFIDSASSVSPINSFPLKPYAAITWDSGQPIWVCTQGTATATVTANPAAQIVNSPGFASVDTLYTYPGNPPGFTGAIIPPNWWTQAAYIIDGGAPGPNQGAIIVETGSYKSLVISGYMMLNSASRTISDMFEITVGWSTAPAAPVNSPITTYTEIETFWVSSLNTQQSIIIPVKGAYAAILVTTQFSSPLVAGAGFTIAGSTTSLDPAIGTTLGGSCTIEIGGTVDANNCQNKAAYGTIYRDFQTWTGLTGVTANDMTILVPGTAGGIVNVQANITLDGLSYGPWQTVTVHALDGYRPNTGVGGPSDLVTTTVNGTTSVSFTAAYMVPYVIQFSSSGSNMKGASYSYNLTRSQASFLKPSPTILSVNQQPAASPIALPTNTWVDLSILGGVSPATFTVNRTTDIVMVTIDLSLFTDGSAFILVGQSVDGGATPSGWITTTQTPANSWNEHHVSYAITGLSPGTHTSHCWVRNTAAIMNITATGASISHSGVIIPGN